MPYRCTGGTLAALRTTMAMQLDLAEVLLQRQDVDSEIVQVQSPYFFPRAMVQRGRFAGHAMMGLSLGPITGHIMANILCNDYNELPLDALLPGRFA